MYRVTGAKKKNRKKLIGKRANAFSIRLTQQEKIIVDVGASVGLLRNQNNKHQLRSKHDAVSIDFSNIAIRFPKQRHEQLYFSPSCVGVVFVFVAGTGARGTHLISCRRLTINGSVFTRKCGVYFIFIFAKLAIESEANVSNIPFSFINFNWFFRMLWQLPHALPAIFN